MNDDQGNFGILVSGCGGLGVPRNLWKIPLLGAGIGLGPIMGEGTLEQGCSELGGVAVGAGPAGLDLLEDSKGNISGDLRLGPGAGFYAASIGCKSVFIKIGNFYTPYVDDSMPVVLH